MRWATLVSPNDARLNEQSVDPQELLLAQLMTVRLVLLQDNHINLDSDDWESLLAWLDLKVPESARDSRRASDYRPALKRWLKRATTSVSPDDDISCLLVQLVEHIGELLQLSDAERDLLIIAWLRLRHHPMNPVLSGIESSRAPKTLSMLLGHSGESILQGLSSTGRLHMLGLLGDKPLRFHDLEDAISSGSLLDSLAPLATEALAKAECASLKELVSTRLMSLCPPLPKGNYSLSSFDAVPLRQLLMDYLRQALAQRRHGANVLIHGQPGVGKTELVKTLASHLNVPLYGVPSCERDHQPLSPSKRLGRYGVVQQLLQQQPALVMFDEIEDVMTDEEALPKGWTNQQLERNPVPGIWVSNSVRWLDPAYQRRFDLIIEVKASTGPQARSRFQVMLADIPITHSARSRLAEQPWMTPALAQQLGRISGLLNEKAPLRNEQHLECLLSDRLQAQGMSPEGSLLRDNVPEPATGMPAYELGWLNTTPSLEHIIKRLQRRGRGRLCLHGLPGSGKTAMAAHLAKQLGRELITAHASSLMDKFVGGTEEKIAELFRRACEKKAVLLLDEIDSLLMSRDGAQQSWEISHTNELLVQLENFNGILLATTNRHDSLDRAVMRRFDLKVAFHPLAPKQLRSLLKTVLPKRDHARLAAIPDHNMAQRRLTPGNVRTALDQLDLRGLPVRFNTLMEALAQEERQQQGSKGPLGFV
ncbi:AAA family ATPase [Halomonas sp. Bachu 37]|uniref:AAA family ATPase n=1 Tax=Halomonas kashgarensis TaxID=3084920 RepID=UPI0032168D59